MMRQWRLIYDSPASGAHNMAKDDAILEAVIAGESLPTLRFYAWSPPCLSLGYAQASEDADQARIESFGWEVVRRPTGGKAILHTDELTYSVAMPLDHPLATGDIVESYRRISQALVTALQFLGVDPHSEKMTHSDKQTGAVCFETPSHYEITVNGRKLIGSAQVRRKNGVLQHGSLPLSGDLGRICDALAYPDAITREQAKHKVYQRAITLEEALGRVIDWQIVADAIVEGFRSAFDYAFVVDSLSLSEQRYAQDLIEGRYNSLERIKGG
ncbi:MAG: lipoate--protein ligase family protein [Anaerolineae bacterium]|jgi:lipoate-protein ligase A|nr:lipoate--protein ligase family protein [Anaerolineae bacterium]